MKKTLIVIAVVIIFLLAGYSIARAFDFVFPTGVIQFLGGPQLDHFEISAISSPQTAGVPFQITIKAKKQDNQDLTNWNDAVTMQGPPVCEGTFEIIGNGDTWDPCRTAKFSNGQWSGSIVGYKIGQNMSFTVIGGVGLKTGTSNTFDIVPGALNHFSVNCRPDTINPNQTSVCTASSFQDIGGNAITDPTILAGTTWFFQAGASSSYGDLKQSVDNPNQATFTAGTPKTTLFATIVAKNGNISQPFSVIIKINPPLFPIKVDYNPDVINNPPPGFTIPSSGTVSEKAP